jgi:arsenate reductase
MKHIQYYGYNKCSTCRKAQKWLEDNNVVYVEHAIVDNPPTQAALKRILASGKYELKDLFNKSGVLYREMNMKDVLPTLTQPQAIKLLAENGKLIKRPILTDGTLHTIGFKEDEFKAIWIETIDHPSK